MTCHLAVRTSRSRLVSKRELRGWHTQGCTVDEARRRIVEAMELVGDDERRASILDAIKFPTSAWKAILHEPTPSSSSAFSRRRSRGRRQPVWIHLMVRCVGGLDGRCSYRAVSAGAARRHWKRFDWVEGKVGRKYIRDAPHSASDVTTRLEMIVLPRGWGGARILARFTPAVTPVS